MTKSGCNQTDKKVLSRRIFPPQHSITDLSNHGLGAEGVAGPQVTK